MIRFTSLASSSAGCAYLLECNGSLLLIEAGISFRRLQEKLKFRTTDVDLCLISHGHGDHACGVKDLANRSAIRCFGSDATLEVVGGAVWPVCPDRPYIRGKWTFQAFEAVHDSPGTFGWIVRHQAWDKDLVYLTDSCYSAHTFGKGIGIYAIEANYDPEILRRNVARGILDDDVARRTIQTHMSIDRCIDLLKANDLSQCEEIYLLHLSDLNSHAEDFKARVRSATGVPTFVCGKNGGVE